VSEGGREREREGEREEAREGVRERGRGGDREGTGTTEGQAKAKAFTSKSTLEKRLLGRPVLKEACMKAPGPCHPRTCRGGGRMVHVRTTHPNNTRREC